MNRRKKGDTVIWRGERKTLEQEKMHGWIFTDGEFGDHAELRDLTQGEALAEIAKIGQEQDLLDLIHRLETRADIRRQIPNRKSVQNGEPDRIADLLDEAASMLRGFYHLHFEDTE